MGRGKKPFATRSASAATTAASSSRPGARVAGRKAEKPQLYCSRCLWMTGGGDCERHGGPKWSDERQRLATAVSAERASAAELARLAELAGDKDRALFPLSAGTLLEAELDRHGRLHLRSGEMTYHYEADRLLELVTAGEQVADKAHLTLTPLELEALGLWLKERVPLDEAGVPVGKRSRKSALAG